MSDVAPLGEVRVIPLAKIRPHPTNPRRITDKAVAMTAASIKEFGWQQPIVVDAEYVIIVGHVRRLAALKLKLRTAPVIVETRLSDEQVRAYRIADNRDHDYTVWDYGLLGTELAGLDRFAEVLDLADWRTLIAGFEQQEETRELGLTETEQAMFGLQYTVTVIFESQDAADAAGPEILKIPGVLDVRHQLARIADPGDGNPSG